jgi:multidrug efflux pump subunit AcrA (membrane-fusion protein)
MPQKTHVLLSMAALCLALAGCQKKSAQVAGGIPPVRVIAIEVKREPVSETVSLNGDIAPNESVEMKAESEGIVQEIPFDEGQKVEKGQLLLRLDESKWAASR